MTLYDIASDPEKARLIELLYEGYQVSYDELLKEMNVKPKKLNGLLEEIRDLWESPEDQAYFLSERGKVAYGIVKSRNVRIKKQRKENSKKEKGPDSFFSSLKKRIFKRSS